MTSHPAAKIIYKLALQKREFAKFTAVQSIWVSTMPGYFCIVCGNSRSKQPQLRYHRFPSELRKRALWLQAFSLAEDEVKHHYRVCSRNFQDGNPQNKPETTIGKKFVSPKRKDAPRTKKAELRQKAKDYQASIADTASRAIAELPIPLETRAVGSDPPPELGFSGVHPEVHPGDQNSHDSESEDPISTTATTITTTTTTTAKFSIEQIKHDDELVYFYTGFNSYKIYLAFFQFLGPAVSKLNYTGVLKLQPQSRDSG